MLCALGAAICSGAATVFQAAAARAARGGKGGEAALLLRAVRQWRYLLGLGLDILSFVLQITALRLVPIYLVGAALASSLAVTALTAARLLKVRLTRFEWGAVAVVCAGLAMLGVASGREGDRDGPAVLPYGMLALAVLVLLLGLAGGRLPDRVRPWLLGLAAGIGFGVVDVAVRLLDTLTLWGIVTDISTYTLMLSGCASLLCLTSGLQSGSVTAATAMMVLGETVGPAAVGVAWLGDRPHAGLGWLALLGFAVAVSGALGLARFGEPPAGDAGSAGGSEGGPGTPGAMRAPAGG